MTYIKTETELATMKKAGKILAETLTHLCEQVKPGITELELDAMAEKMIREKGGKEAFKFVPGWHHTICVSTNEVIVHGIPTERKLREGDIIGIDCGVYLDGLNTDMAETVYVGDQKTMPLKIRKFLKAGKEAMEAGIRMVKAGNHVGHISKAVQQIIEGNGYAISRSLIGHGVGKDLHEAPEVPGYLAKPIEKTPLLREGMTIAVEVIYAMGSADIAYANNDGWTLRTKDGSLTGLFERTVAIKKDGYTILTV